MRFEWLLRKKKINGKTAEEWRDDGDAFLIASRYEEAVKCYDKILGVDPKDEVALKKREMAMQEFKRMGEKQRVVAQEAIKNPEKLLEDAKRLGLPEEILKSAKSHSQNKYYKNALNDANDFERDIKNTTKDEKQRAVASHGAIKNAEALLEDAKRLGLSEDKLNNAKSHFQRNSYENALKYANDFKKDVKNAIEDEKRSAAAHEAIKNAEALLEDAKRLGLSENKLKNAVSHLQKKSYESALNDANSFIRHIKNAIEDDKLRAAAHEAIKNAEDLLEDAKRLGLSENKLKNAKSYFQNKYYKNALKYANHFERDVKNAIEVEKQHVASAHEAIKNAEALLEDAKRLGSSEEMLKSAKSHFQKKSYESALNDARVFIRLVKNAIKDEKRSAAAHEAIKNAEALLEDAKRLGLSENKLKNAQSYFQSKSYKNALNDAIDFERDVKNAIEVEKQHAAAHEAIKNAEALLKDAKRLGLSEYKLKNAQSYFQSKSYENALNDAIDFERDVKNTIENEQQHAASGHKAIKNAEALLKDAKRLGLPENKLRNAQSYFQSKSYINALNDANDFERDVKNAIEDEKRSAILQEAIKNAIKDKNQRVAAQEAIRNAEKLLEDAKRFGLSEEMLKNAKSCFQSKSYEYAMNAANDFTRDVKNAIKDEKQRVAAQEVIKNAENLLEEANAMGLSLPDNYLKNSKSLFQSKSYESALNNTKDFIRDIKNVIEVEKQRIAAHTAINSAKEKAKILDELGLSFKDFEKILRNAEFDYDHKRYANALQKSNECIKQAEKFINVKKPIIEGLKKDASFAIKNAETLLEEANAMRLSVSDIKLKDSKSLFQSKSYKNALKNANDFMRDVKKNINEEKNRQKAHDSINSITTSLDKLTKLCMDIPDTGEIKAAYESKNYIKASEDADKLREEIESRISSSKPTLVPKLHMTDFKLGAGKKTQIILMNDGKTPARNISLNLASEEVAARILSGLEILNSGDSKTIDVWIKPTVEGDLPVEISLKYTDGIDRSYETKEEVWISVSDKVKDIVSSGANKNIAQTPVDFSPRPSHTSSFPAELSKFYAEPELIGKGGFARIFRARRKSDGTVVAVKIPINLDEATGRSFVREITAWHNLKHENIVELYDQNVLPIPYLELEYVEKNLEEIKKPMDAETAAGIVFDIAEGLMHAHSKGLIHRDLKPHNILLTGDFVPKITDWGLSKIMAESKTSSQYGFSPVYAAPEQISPKKFGTPDKRTDIYQLGVVFYELVCGRLPFGGDDFAEISSAIIFEEPEAPSSVIAEAKVVEQIILTSLAKKKEERYQSIEELQRDLGKYLQIEYKKSLKESLSKHNMKRSSHYCCELFLLNLKLQEVSDALKYCLDMQNYAKGEIKDEVVKLTEALKFRVKEGSKIGDEFMEAAKVVAHQVRMGWK